MKAEVTVKVKREGEDEESRAVSSFLGGGMGTLAGVAKGKERALEEVERGRSGVELLPPLPVLLVVCEGTSTSPLLPSSSPCRDCFLPSRTRLMEVWLDEQPSSQQPSNSPSSIVQRSCTNLRRSLSPAEDKDKDKRRRHRLSCCFRSLR